MSVRITPSRRLFRRYEARPYAAVVRGRDELIKRLNELPPESLILWLDPRTHGEIGVFARLTDEPITIEVLAENWRADVQRELNKGCRK